MARTKQTSRKSTGATAPRNHLIGKRARKVKVARQHGVEAQSARNRNAWSENPHDSSRNPSNSKDYASDKDDDATASSDASDTRDNSSAENPASADASSNSSNSTDSARDTSFFLHIDLLCNPTSNQGVLHSFATELNAYMVLTYAYDPRCDHNFLDTTSDLHSSDLAAQHPNNPSNEWLQALREAEQVDTKHSSLWKVRGRFSLEDLDKHMTNWVADKTQTWLDQQRQQQQEGKGQEREEGCCITMRVCKIANNEHTNVRFTYSTPIMPKNEGSKP